VNEKILAEASFAALVAPAGCGKTHLIAKSVAKYNSGRELILTHTHAGVDSLKTKLKKVGAKEKTYSVETIAGFCLKYTSSYPELSELSISMPRDQEWAQIYIAMSKLLKSKHVQEIIRLSYTGFYVDEYQDCSIPQHDFILNLAKALPRCRVLGDPLQGIFNFKKEPTIDWDRDITSQFLSLEPLKTPHRWEHSGGCSELGAWLLSARENFKNKSPVDLSSAPQSVNHILVTKEQDLQHIQMTQCFKMQNLEGSVVCISAHRNQNYSLAQRLNGGFSSLEPIDSKELYSYCEEIEKSKGYDRCLKVIELASECLIVATLLSPLKKNYEQKKPYNGAKLPEITALFVQMNIDESLSLVEMVLLAIKTTAPKKFKRDELFYSFLSALKEYKTGNNTSLKEAAWQVRNKLRFIGRGTARKVLGTTLLVKGLEYDHCLILNADDLKPQELYVAMTRGSKTLSIISKSSTLQTYNSDDFKNNSADITGASQIITPPDLISNDLQLTLF